MTFGYELTINGNIIFSHREDGKSHDNILIFDFWGLTAEQKEEPDQGQVNCLRYEYERSHESGDSHPNTKANEAVGPVFGKFIVNALKNK